MECTLQTHYGAGSEKMTHYTSVMPTGKCFGSYYVDLFALFAGFEIISPTQEGTNLIFVGALGSVH